MNKKIFILILLFAVFLSSAFEVKQEYVLVELDYENGNFSFVNKSLETGNYPTLSHTLAYDYEADLISDNGEVLYFNTFDPTLLHSESAGESGIEGGAIVLNNSKLFILTPNFRNAEKIEILKKGEKIFAVDVYDVGATSCRLK